MTQVGILCISVLLIGICIYAVMRTGNNRESGFVKFTSAPEQVQIEFVEFVQELLIKEGILLLEGKITKMEKLEEVAYDNGSFEYHKLEYLLTPAENVESAGGIVLNSREIMAKAGINDNLVVLFFKDGEEVYEISFLPEKRVMLQGYKAHIDKKYRDVKERFPLDEYGLNIGGQNIRLWDNLCGEYPVPNVDKHRTKAEGELLYNGRFVDIFTNEDLEVHSWVQFERRRELIFTIRAKSYKAQTTRGIGVGSTVEELKQKYSMNLSYLEDLNGEGPAYGYIPEDESHCYLAFRVENQVIIEVIATDTFGDRQFIPKDGYVDQDIPWIEADYSDRLTEKYARSLYLGQHRADLDERQVFNTFVTNNFQLGSIVEKGLWKEYELMGEKLYYVICEDTKEGTKLYVEIKLKSVLIDTFTNQTSIWVVSHHRSQKKRR